MSQDRTDWKLSSSLVQSPWQFPMGPPGLPDHCKYGNQQQYQSQHQLPLARIPHAPLVPQRAVCCRVTFITFLDVKGRLTNTQYVGETKWICEICFSDESTPISLEVPKAALPSFLLLVHPPQHRPKFQNTVLSEDDEDRHAHCAGVQQLWTVLQWVAVDVSDFWHSQEIQT